MNSPATTSPLLPPSGVESYRWGDRIEEVLASHAAAQPEAVAVQQGEQTLSYRELNETALTLAAALHRLRVEAGSQVAIRLPRSPALVSTLLGVFRSGAAAIVTDRAWPRERVLDALRLGRTELLISAEQGTVETAAAALGIKVLTLAELQGRAGTGAERLIATRDGRATASIFYTSGSTGAPKGILSPHRGVVRTVVDCPGLPLDRETVFLQAAPLPWDAFHLELWAPLLNGGKVVLLDPGSPALDAAGFTEAIRQGVNSAWLTSSLFTLLVEEHCEAFKDLRLLLVGGERVSITTARTLLAAHPDLQLVNGYGPAEATIFATIFPVTKDSLAEPNTELPIGRAMPQTPLLLLDESGTPISSGTGELAVGGDGVALGYTGQPEETAKRFFQHGGERYYRTGDLVEVGADGLLRYRGRIDHQVKISGVRIEPGEVEAALEQHPAVSAACMVAVEHRGSTVLGGGVAGAGLPPVEALIDFLRERLLPAMLPAILVPLAEIPLTGNGKADRAKIGQLVADAVAAQHSMTDPAAAAIEDPLLSEARLITGLDDLQLGTPLLAAGASSLSLIRLAARLSRALRSEIRVADLYREGSIAGVLASLGAQPASGASASDADQAEPKGSNPAEAPLSRAQQRFWLAEMAGRGAADNTVMLCYAIEGPLDRELFADSLRGVVAGHAALRTRYPWKGESPIQQVLPAAASAAELLVEQLPEDLRQLPWPELAAVATREAWQEAFDLEAAPPLRFRLVAAGQDRHLLVIHAHHIAIDGWSEQVLIDELTTAYRTSAAQPGQAEAAVLQLGRREDAHLTASLTADLPYWRELLADAPAAFLPAPADPGEAERREACFTVPPATVNTLASLAGRAGAPLSAVFLAAAAASLGERFDRPELTLGLVDPGRSELTEQAIGYFVNPYPVRLQTGQSAQALLDECAREILAGLEHSRLPFDEIVKQLSPSRGRHPWFQSFVVLQAAHLHRQLGAGLTLSSVRVAAPRMTTELTIEAFPTLAGGWECVIAWRADGLDEAAGQALAASIRDFLNTLANDPAGLAAAGPAGER